MIKHMNTRNDKRNQLFYIFIVFEIGDKTYAFYTLV